MTIHEAIQIIKVMGYVAEHDGTVDADVTNDAVRMAVAALKLADAGTSERMTKWEGRNPDGSPRAVLARREGLYWDALQPALRKLAVLEDLLEQTKEGTD